MVFKAHRSTMSAVDMSYDGLSQLQICKPLYFYDVVAYDVVKEFLHDATQHLLCWSTPNPPVPPKFGKSVLSCIDVDRNARRLIPNARRGILISSLCRPKTLHLYENPCPVSAIQLSWAAVRWDAAARRRSPRGAGRRATGVCSRAGARGGTRASPETAAGSAANHATAATIRITFGHMLSIF